jgi:hypothetical protein
VPVADLGLELLDLADEVVEAVFLGFFVLHPGDQELDQFGVAQRGGRERCHLQRAGALRDHRFETAPPSSVAVADEDLLRPQGQLAEAVGS